MTTLFLDSVQLDTPLTHPHGVIPASVLSIGNFDGVHLGHQAMLKALQAAAKQHNLATMVMIFEPQPREYFAQLKGQSEMAPARLTSQNEKIVLLKKFGIDTVVVAKFDAAFRSLSAAQFANMLVNKLNVHALVLGDDFKFGHDRGGNSQFLREYGLPVTDLHTITDMQAVSASQTENSQAENSQAETSQATLRQPYRQDTRISSTRIRELLQAGDLTTANRLLGHDYAITGKVIHGDAIGRTLDFPTANIELNRTRPALRGIYGVDVVIVNDNNDSDDKVNKRKVTEFGHVERDGTSKYESFNDVTSDHIDQMDHMDQKGVAGLRPNSLFGAANIGTRPSIDKPHEWRLEVFFPNFSGDLYGKTLEVRFLHYLHGERQYDGLAALKAGIHQDVADLLAWRYRQ